MGTRWGRGHTRSRIRKCDHDAMVADERVWNALPLMSGATLESSRLHFPWGQVLELRNCPVCWSTISRELVHGEPERWDRALEGDRAARNYFNKKLPREHRFPSPVRRAHHHGC